MIYVELFGNFKMCRFEDKEKPGVGVPLPAKSGCVLAYILLNRQRAISKDELIDTFWSDPSSTNPVNAFKTLLFRVRGALNQCVGEDEYIIEKNGSYQWNQKIDVEIDVETFASLIEKGASEELSNTQRILIFESALKIYKGDFLSNVHNVYWADLTNGYYRSLNIKMTLQLINFYMKEKEYKSIENLCVNSLKTNYIDEDIYYYLILAKIFLNERQEAREVYTEALNVLKREMGLQHPEKLESLNEKLVNQNSFETKNLYAICKEIEEQELQGTFICQYTVFSEICRLEYRKMLREKFSGDTLMTSRHIVLMTIKDKHSSADNTGKLVSEEKMKKIERIIVANLRLGDVISRCSSNQFIFLLLGCTVENCMMISKRIKFEIDRMKPGLECRIQYHRLSSGNIITK